MPNLVQRMTRMTIAILVLALLISLATIAIQLATGQPVDWSREAWTWGEALVTGIIGFLLGYNQTDAHTTKGE